MSATPVPSDIVLTRLLEIWIKSFDPDALPPTSPLGEIGG
jgi:hypothetical protein